MNNLKLNDQLCFPVYVLARQITALYRPHLEQLGITYPQYLVMLVVWEHETVCVREIGERLWLDSGTLTPLLKRMEKHGWISRSRSEKDERIVLIHCSEKGKQLEKKASVLPEILKKEIDSGEGQIINLKNQLNQLLSAISQNANQSKK